MVDCICDEFVRGIVGIKDRTPYFSTNYGFIYVYTPTKAVAPEYEYELPVFTNSVKGDTPEPPDDPETDEPPEEPSDDPETDEPPEEPSDDPETDEPPEEPSDNQTLDEPEPDPNDDETPRNDDDAGGNGHTDDTGDKSAG